MGVDTGVGQAERRLFQALGGDAGRGDDGGAERLDEKDVLEEFHDGISDGMKGWVGSLCLLARELRLLHGHTYEIGPRTDHGGSRVQVKCDEECTRIDAKRARRSSRCGRDPAAVVGGVAGAMRRRGWGCSAKRRSLAQLADLRRA